VLRVGISEDGRWVIGRVGGNAAEHYDSKKLPEGVGGKTTLGGARDYGGRRRWSPLHYIVRWGREKISNRDSAKGEQRTAPTALGSLGKA